MTAPPAFTRRPETPEDAGFRFDLFRASREPGETFDGFDPGFADRLLRSQFDGQHASYRAAHPDGAFDIIEVAGASVGRIVVDERAAAWTLVDIALVPEARGRGLGTAVLHALCAAADGAGASVTLAVRAGNPARRLYARMGFVAGGASDCGAEMIRPAAVAPVIGMPDRLRLPLVFDAAALAVDLDGLGDTDWIRHFVTANYDGDWDVIPLRAKAGATHPVTMILSDPAARDYVDTPLLAACPALRAALARFRCPLESVRLMRLRPGSIIKEHRDHDLDFECGAVRIHVPIRTNPQVDFQLNGRRVALEPGSAWYLRLSDPHGVANRGTTDRIHLVIDARVDGWVEALFAEATAGTER